MGVLSMLERRASSAAASSMTLKRCRRRACQSERNGVSGRRERARASEKMATTKERKKPTNESEGGRELRSKEETGVWRRALALERARFWFEGWW